MKDALIYIATFGFMVFGFWISPDMRRYACRGYVPAFTPIAIPTPDLALRHSVKP